MENRELNKNNIYNSLATFLNLLFPIITFPYITRILGVDNIGKFNFSSSVVSYFNLIATLGIASYAIRECAKLKDDRKKLNALASDIFSIDVYSTILAYILLFITLLASSKLKDYSTYILILSTSFLINTLGTTWLCNAVNDFKYLSIRSIFIHLFSLIGLFIFVRNESHLYIYTILIVISNAGANIFTVFYRKKYVDIRFNIFPDIKKHLKKIILMFSQTVSMLLYTNADMIMLGYYYNDETVGVYAIAVKVYNIVNGVISSVISVATPSLSYDYNKKDYESFNNKLSYVVNYILLLFIPAFIGINVMANEIISLVSGESLLVSANALRVLTFSLLFSLISATLGIAILFPMGYDRVNFNSCIISAVGNILLNIYFIPKYGVLGAAFTTAVAELLGFINKIKYIDNNIRVDGIFKMISRYFLPSLFIIAVCMLSKKVIMNQSLRALIAIPISAICYFTTLFFIKDRFLIDLIKPIYNKFLHIVNK